MTKSKSCPKCGNDLVSGQTPRDKMARLILRGPLSSFNGTQEEAAKAAYEMVDKILKDQEEMLLGGRND